MQAEHAGQYVPQAEPRGRGRGDSPVCLNALGYASATVKLTFEQLVRGEPSIKTRAICYKTPGLLINTLVDECRPLPDAVIWWPLFGKRSSMISAIRIFVVLALPFLVDIPLTLAQQKPSANIVVDPRIGKKVIVIRAGAELRTPESTVWRAYLGEVYTVSLTNGEWLWINEKGGWLWEKDTVKFDTAIEELSRRVTSTATPENYHLRGVAFLAHEQYDKAIADFTESLRRNPRNAGALNNRGQASYLKEDYKAAIQDFTAAITIDPKNFLAINNRALAYIETEEYKLALSDLQAAIKLVPEYPEALNNRGIVYQKLNRLDESVADFTAALKIDPKYVDALGNRAHTYRLKKEYKKAITDLERAMKISPQTYEAVNDLAWLLATTNEDSVRSPQRALELAKRACEITHYQQWNTLDTLAAAQAENGQFADAQQWLATALLHAPEKEKARLQKHMELVQASKPIRQ
jgi:tetratricopeptide (TPR) repeat protein